MKHSPRPQFESSSHRGNPSLPTTSELHALLSADTRRHVLDVLADRTTPLDIEELAGAVAERDGVADPVDDTTDNIVIELYHNHLPRLEDAGLIQYNHEANRVEAIHQVVSD